MSLKDASKYLSLSDAISSLKTELDKADQLAQQNRDEMFVLKECEIELSLEFEPKVEAGFDIGVFKVTAGAGAKGGHKIKVTYEPSRRIVAVMKKRAASAPAALGPAKFTKKRTTK